jgi:ADP-ribose pyrophosphatase YjhB (NUDIX family)
MVALSFDSFLNERWSAGAPKKSRVAAGITLIYNNKILLVHPTNSSWKKATCGIPKGGIEPGEDPMEAAIRELYEETGIEITPDMLDQEPRKVDFYNHRREPDGHMIYFVCEVETLDQIKLKDERVPKNQLQLKEVDWAKFVPAEEAYPIMSHYQLIILDRHLSK